MRRNRRNPNRVPLTWAPAFFVWGLFLLLVTGADVKW